MLIIPRWRGKYFDLKEFKIEILRFNNDEVINEPDLVIEKIRRTIEILKKSLVQKPNQGPIVC